MDFKIITTTLGDVLYRRDIEGDNDVLVIHWYAKPDIQATMTIRFKTDTSVRALILEADATFAEKWVQKQASILW